MLAAHLHVSFYEENLLNQILLPRPLLLLFVDKFLDCALLPMALITTVQDVASRRSHDGIECGQRKAQRVRAKKG